MVVIGPSAANYIKLLSDALTHSSLTGICNFRDSGQSYDLVVGRIDLTREVVAARLAQRYVKVHSMEVALMIPCYVDVFYPQVGIVTLELLERLGVEVVYPKEQTCCGRPMADSGRYEEARATENHCASVLGSFEYVVTPSGSCTHHIRNKSTAGTDSLQKDNLIRNTYDLVEFLHDVLKVREFPWATFEHKVAFHTSCSAIRGLNMASMTERVHDPVFSKPKTLLSGVRGVQFVDFDRVDECCGFGARSL
jgi:L-lactate dehydrogenase complex protein LldE